MPPGGQVPKLADYRAPWEVDRDGNAITAEDQKLDPERLKAHLVNLLNDKEKAQAARDKALEEVEAAKAKVEEIGDSKREATEVENQLKGQIKELQKRIDKAPEKSVREIKLEKALASWGIDKDGNVTVGLSVRQAMRLQGEDEDSIAEDLAAELEERGLVTVGTKGGHQEQEGPPNGRPRTVRNPGNPKEDEPMKMGAEAGIAEADRRFKPKVPVTG